MKKVLLAMFVLLFHGMCAFAFEPSYILGDKVKHADLIIVGVLEKTEVAEIINYQRSDFKLLSERNTKDKITKLEVEEKTDPLTGARQLIENRSTTEDPNYHAEPEIYLNGKRISQEQYAEYQYSLAEGKPKIIRKFAFIKSEQVIKGVPQYLSKDSTILLDYEPELKEDMGVERSLGRDAPIFYENDHRQRILFLQRKDNGHYALVNYVNEYQGTGSGLYNIESGLYNIESDMIIDNNTVFFCRDIQECCDEYPLNVRQELDYWPPKMVPRGSAPPGIGIVRGEKTRGGASLGRTKYTMATDEYIKIILQADQGLARDTSKELYLPIYKDVVDKEPITYQ